MSQLRLEVPIDPARIRDDQSAEQTLRAISARLVPGLESHVGPIEYGRGDRTGVTWSTEGWFPDKTFVVLLKLFMDTGGLQPPRPPISRAYTAALVLSMVIASGGAAWRFRAFWPTAGALVDVLVLWCSPTPSCRCATRGSLAGACSMRPTGGGVWRQRPGEHVGGGPASS
jgi:hypothetical protein